MRVLAGDIGGTNARLAIVDIDEDEARFVHEGQYRSEGFSGLGAVVQGFLAKAGHRPSHACFGVPCPIVGGRCVGTNLSWTIDAVALASEIGIARTVLINDFHAAGEGVQRLTPDGLATLHEGEPMPRGVKALIGAGTGLGQAFLTWRERDYRVHDSEGGHSSFSAREPAEWDLLQTLAGHFGHVSRERVVSGPGLLNIYRHLAAQRVDREQRVVTVAMSSEDPAAVIARHALAGTDPLCVRALDMFVSAYGAMAGNFALTVMARGGVYVGGGIAPRILPKLQDGGFMSAFLEKGRLSYVLARIPVHVIIEPRVGLLGAASVAFRTARGSESGGNAATIACCD